MKQEKNDLSIFNTCPLLIKLRMGTKNVSKRQQSDQTRPNGADSNTNTTIEWVFSTARIISQSEREIGNWFFICWKKNYFI